jgi:MFS family permease
MVAHRSRPSTAMLSLIGLAFGVMLLVVAAAPTEVIALVALVFMGLCSISFIATANATIQLKADPAMRGRVMALYAIAFLGSTPIGAPLVGWIADVTTRGSPSWSEAWPPWPPASPSPFATGLATEVAYPQRQNRWRGTASMEDGCITPLWVVPREPLVQN